MHRFFRRLFKVLGIIFIALFIALLILINIFFQPQADEEIVTTFSEANVELYLQYREFNNHKYRVISTKKELDSTLPNLIFIHGSPGSGMDYKKYLFDSDLNSKVNMIAYDRVGYGINNLGEIGSIGDEVDFLNSLVDTMDISNTILFGYSYGGPIALASKNAYKKIVLCAPAVSSEVEPMFWFLNFYKWKVTRWMLPTMLQTASKEKLNHPTDLITLESNWGNTPNSLVVIHGDADWIVPYENSEFIQKQFPVDTFRLITLKGVSHDLIWTQFDVIKSELLKVIEE